MPKAGYRKSTTTEAMQELKSIYQDTAEVFHKYATDRTDWRSLVRDMEAINSRLQHVRLRDDHNWAFHNLVKKAVTDVVDSNLVHCKHMAMLGKSEQVKPHL